MPSTIGASFLVKKLVVEGIACRLQIWDTAGQERFRSMAPMYYRGSNAAIIVYDITSRESFADVKSWIDELKKMTDEEDLIIHVVGCKKDLAPFGREVDREDARRQIDEWTRPPKPPPPLQPLTRPPVKPGHGSHGGSLSRLSTFASMAVRGGGSAINASVSSLTRPSTAVEVSSTSAGTGSGTAGDDMHDQDGFSRMDGVGLTEVSAKDGEGIEEGEWLRGIRTSSNNGLTSHPLPSSQSSSPSPRDSFSVGMPSNSDDKLVNATASFWLHRLTKGRKI